MVVFHFSAVPSRLTWSEALSARRSARCWAVALRNRQSQWREVFLPVIGLRDECSATLVDRLGQNAEPSIAGSQRWVRHMLPPKDLRVVGKTLCSSELHSRTE